MKRYKAVIFDWDGTVMDSTASIVRAIQAACTDLELPVPSVEDASWVIGLSLKEALMRCAPSLKEDQVPRFIDRYRHHFFLHDRQQVLFDGVVPLFEQLKQHDIRLGVATGKSRLGLNRVLEAHQLTHHFDCTRCADETEGKPHPAMLFEIMETLDLEPEQVLMVGDTTHDVKMATAAGVDSMAVTYGAHSKRTLLMSQPTVMVSSVREMRHWLTARL
ncbi:MAG TPA: HAD-IA family hydrolase [Burkholderiaceae bacterium]|nr:HAD-IA family hydrolase [Burkholderiaceae bacterium]